MRQYSN